MLRIGFIGVPGAGKTSTARALAAMCRRNPLLKNVELVSEYARRYIAKYDVPREPWEQILIFNKQKEWEDSVGYADLMITDSPLHLGWGYAMEIIQRDEKDAASVRALTSMMMKLDFPEPRYDIIFRLPPRIQPVNDGIRAAHHFDDKWRHTFDERLLAIFTLFKPKRLVTILDTDLDMRAEAALFEIGKYLKERESNEPAERTATTGASPACP